MRLLVLMDPPDRVDRYTDTTVAIVEEALRRHDDVAVATTNDLWLDEGEPGVAYHHALRPLPGGPEPTALRRGKGGAATIAGRFDVVLLRRSPPFDLDYLLATHLLERLRDRVTVVNDPRGLREANERLYPLRFPELVPPTLVTRGVAALHDFLHRQGGELLLKPLDRLGGADVFHLRQGDRNLHAIVETATAGGQRLVMAQRYLPEARQGDKRVLLWDGAILGVLGRRPREDETRSGLPHGGSALLAELDPREQGIVDQIVPALRRDGLLFAALDLIGGCLADVNVTNPGGLRELDHLTGRREGDSLAAAIVDGLERAAQRSAA